MTLVDALRTVARRLGPPAGRPVPLGRGLRIGSPAPAVVAGIAPDGTAVNVALSGSEVRLVFLTSDCRECSRAWDRVATGTDKDMVVVTPGPETESRRRVAERLSSAEGQPVTVVMSSQAWHTFGVSRAPWLIEISEGRVSASGRFR